MNDFANITTEATKYIPNILSLRIYQVEHKQQLRLEIITKKGSKIRFKGKTKQQIINKIETLGLSYER